MSVGVMRVENLNPGVLHVSQTQIVVYYESLKRELKTKPIKECRCDERLQTRVEESTRLACPRLVSVPKKEAQRSLDYIKEEKRKDKRAREIRWTPQATVRRARSM